LCRTGTEQTEKKWKKPDQMPGSYKGPRPASEKGDEERKEINKRDGETKK